MLAPESSPVHQLVAIWWREKELPRYKDVPARRRELLEAVVREFELLDGWYDFTSDVRAIWASHWLNRAENRTARIHPDTTARAAWFFDSPLTPCGKDLAAGAN